MHLAIYLPLVVPLFAAAAARPLAERLPPVAATWLLALERSRSRRPAARCWACSRSPPWPGSRWSSWPAGISGKGDQAQ